MTKFKWKQDQGCDSCDADVPVIETKHMDLRQRDEPVFMCEICYSSFIGNAYFYPNQYPYHTVMSAIAAVGNLIRKDLGAFDNCEKSG